MVLIGWWRKNQIALSVGVLVYEKREGSSLIPMGWVEVEDFVGLNLGSVVEQPWLLYFSTSGFSCQGMLVHRGTGNTRTRRIAPCHHLGAYQYIVDLMFLNLWVH